MDTEFEIKKIFVARQRNTICPKLRWLIKKRDNFMCCQCGVKEEERPLQVDHIIPVSKGGVTEESNLQTLCSDCNILKKDKIHPKYINNRNEVIRKALTVEEKKRKFSDFFLDSNDYISFAEFIISKESKDIEELIALSVSYNSLRDHFSIIKKSYEKIASEKIETKKMLDESNVNLTDFQKDILELMKSGIKVQKDMVPKLIEKGYIASPQKISTNLKWLKKKGVIII